jgi:hypothetical protein
VEKEEVPKRVEENAKTFFGARGESGKPS